MKLGDMTFESAQEEVEAVAKIMFQQMLVGIEFLHDKMNIIHRDLKLDNILYSSHDHQIKIADFTVSKKIIDLQEKCFDTEGTAAFTGIYY